MNIDDYQFEILQKMAKKIHKPIYLFNQHGRILYTSSPMITSPEWMHILPFFQSRTTHSFSMIHAKQTFSIFPIDLNEQTCDYLVILAFIHPQNKNFAWDHCKSSKRNVDCTYETICRPANGQAC